MPSVTNQAKEELTAENAGQESKGAVRQETAIALDNLNLDPKKYYEAVGRRKTAAARVRVWFIPANQKNIGPNIVINDRLYTDYFKTLEFQKIIDSPLRKLRVVSAFKIKVKVAGSGVRGQAEAIRHGLARVLAGFDPEWRKRLKRSGFLTRDSRMVERKKYGKKKARKSPRWHKR